MGSVCFWLRRLSKHASNIAETRLTCSLTLRQPEKTSGWDSTNAAIHRVGIGNVPPKEKPDVSGRIRGGIDRSSSQESLDLRGGSERVTVVGVVKGLNAVRITR